MIQPFNTTRFVRFVGGFIAKGPFVGWVVVWIEVMAIGLWSRDFSVAPGASALEFASGLAAVLLLSFVLAYMMGAIPAVITGVVCYPPSRLLMPVWLWVLLCAVVGGMVALLSTSLVSFSMPLQPITIMLAFLPGSGAGAICGYQSRRARWAVNPSRSI